MLDILWCVVDLITGFVDGVRWLWRERRTKRESLRQHRRLGID